MERGGVTVVDYGGGSAAEAIADSGWALKPLVSKGFPSGYLSYGTYHVIQRSAVIRIIVHSDTGVGARVSHHAGHIVTLTSLRCCSFEGRCTLRRSDCPCIPVCEKVAAPIELGVETK